MKRQPGSRRRSEDRQRAIPSEIRLPKDVCELFQMVPDLKHQTNLNWRCAYMIGWKPEKDKLQHDRWHKVLGGEYKLGPKKLPIGLPPATEIKDSLQKQGYLMETFALRTDWRLVVGLGAAHVADTAMTIHRIYSAPYIPGSALKGITRDWVRQQIKKHASAFWNEKTFVLAFGSPHNEPQSPKNRGVALFFDAFPKGGFTIRVDVMTPHFKDYYEGKQMDLGNKKVPTPPADWLSPTPIEFLTVENTEFEFLIAVDAYRLKKLQDAGKAPGDVNAQTLLDEVKKALESALRERGVGAKTRLGYGLFKEVKEWRR